MNIKKKIEVFGFVIVILFFGMLFLTNKTNANNAYDELPIAHTFHNATITDVAFLYPPKFDLETPPSHTFEKWERVTVLFCEKPFCMVERYYISMEGSFIGWVYDEHIEMDIEK